MTRAAAVDIGTNTVLLTIAERRGDLVLPLCERARVTRLGAGVDRTRRIAPDARARTLACLDEYGALIARHDVTEVDAVGTSALRDASEDPSFLDQAERALGVRPRVVSGEEEATLTFHGSLSGLGASGPVLVFDVGGGSTEVVSGTAEGAIEHAHSLDIGSVRLFERHVRSDPLAPGELSAVRARVREALASVTPPRGAFQLIGVAGTVTTLAALARPAERLHGARLDRALVEAQAERLARLPLALRIGLANLDPARADVIPVGAAIVSEVLAWSGAAALTVSERGVRWGLIERRLTS